MLTSQCDVLFWFYLAGTKFLELDNDDSDDDKLEIDVVPQCYTVECSQNLGDTITFYS